MAVISQRKRDRAIAGQRERMAEEDQQERRSRLSCLSGPLIEKK